MTFGRAVDCSVVLNDELVSRHHAAIEPTPTGYRLVDTGSRNGVYVGDQRVAELALTHQARFRIGSTTFEFVAPTPRGEPAAPRTFIVRVVSPGVPADAGRSIEADSGIATVGRGDDCTLTLADLATSRHHARIEALEDGRFRLVDTRSANGLWVEGRRVAEETVLPGQRFRIGSTVLECEFLGDATADVERTVMLPAAKPAPAAAAALEATAPPPAPKPPALETAGDALDSVVKPFLLDDPASVYYVASGKVEIFTITVQGQRPVGARTHFLTVGERQAFFGLGLRNSRGLGFMAQGKAGTVVRRISRSTLSAMGEHEVGAAEVARLVDDWVSALSTHLAHDVPTPPTIAGRIDSGQAAALPPGAQASVVSGVRWMPVATQSLLFVSTAVLGPDLSTQQTFFPLTPDTWVESAGAEEVQLIDPKPTAAMLAAGRLWPNLDAFHATLCECELTNKRLAIVDQFERLESKARHSEAAHDAAIDAIGSVLAGSHRPPGGRAAAGSVRPLLEACRLVGAELGIEILTPGESRGDRTVDEQVLAIAAASRCRARQVALRGEWWKGDHGPLLAFRNERDAPVALIPCGTSAYTLVDPGAGTREQVTREIAFALNPFAYSFYRALPPGKLRAWDLVKFGARGLAPEFRSILVLGVLNGVLAAAVPALTGRLIDDAIPAADKGLLVQLGLGMVLLALATAAFKVTQSFAVVRVETRMDYTLQAALWDRVLNLPAGFFRNYGAGDLAERAAGINAIRGVLWQAGVGGILGGLSSIAYLVLMLTYNARLTAIAVGLSLLLVAITTIGNLAQLRFQRRETELRGKLSSLVLQLIAGVAKVRVCSAENHAFRVWAQQFSTQKRSGFTAGQMQNVVITALGGFNILSTLVIFLALWSLQSSAAAGSSPAFTTGTFIAFFVAFGSFSAALQELSDSSLSLLMVVPLFERLRPILETLPESDPTKVSPGKLRGQISVSHLFFRYAADGPWIIKDVSFTIQPGQFVAFVGASGCGKSTVLRLLLGFEQPQSGTIRYDGQDLASLDIRAVRQQFGVVLQESQVLPTDIYRNIVGTSARTLQDAWEAAEMAGLADDIRQMPMGMNTFVSEGGGTFSGGQRQRLLIARALVNKPGIIFFDEATSALDNRAQAVVTQSMDQLEATRIVIAHRLSTIVNANRIIYFEDGQVKEEGTYQELMAKGGAFAALAKRQIA